MERNKQQTKEEAWLSEILPEISRTFAFTIPHLPRIVAKDLAVSYAICRVIDTVEDSILTTEIKRQTLDVSLLSLQQPNDTILRKDCQFLLKSVPTSKNYQRLLDEAPMLIDVFHELPSRIRQIITTISSEMVNGLSDEYVQRINTREDQNRYCHYAAGLVGHLITLVFNYRGYIQKDNIEKMLDLGHDFGVALQKVNILKDVEEDVAEKRLYWPRDTVESSGLNYKRLSPILEKDREKFSNLVSKLIEDVKPYFARGFDYIDGLPHAPEGLRIFCGDNLIFAIATCRILESNDFLYDGTNKISREEVQGIHYRVKEIVRKRGDLRDLGRHVENQSFAEYR